MQSDRENGSGFLPDDYVKERATRRINVAAVVLFVVVMGGVALAYLATDRTWTDVRRAQASVNQRFEAAANQRAEMDAYVDRVERIVDKAHIAVGLLDTVPRSNLLAEIVNRMPDKLSLSRFQMSTTELKPVREKPEAVGTLSTRGRSASNASVDEPAPRPEPSRWPPASGSRASRRASRRSRCSSTHSSRWTCSAGFGSTTPRRSRSTSEACGSSGCSSSSGPMRTSGPGPVRT